MAHGITVGVMFIRIGDDLHEFRQLHDTAEIRKNGKQVGSKTQNRRKVRYSAKMKKRSFG